MIKKYLLFIVLFFSFSWAQNNYNGAVIMPNYKIDRTYLRVATDIMSKNLKLSGINLNIDLLSHSIGLNKLRKKHLDMVAVLPSTYYDNIDLFKNISKTLLTYPINGDKKHFYYLLANKKEKNVLKNLKDYEIQVPYIYEGATILYKTLMYEKYKHKASFYIQNNLKKNSKESKILYESFFDSKKLGIVPKLSFDLINELNPQIGRNLKIIKKSEIETLAIILITTKNLEDKKEKRLINLLKADNNILIENSRTVPSNIVNPVVSINEKDIKETKIIYKKLNNLENKYK